MADESLGLIYERAKNYASLFKWSIENDLKSAILKRNSGAKVLTWREADIAARKKIDLNNKFFILGLSGSFLYEDTPHLTDSIYMLRATYNRGLDWVKNKRQSETPDKQKIGDDYLRGVYEKIELSGLRFWDEEKKNGFHQELLKPEYMTQNEFLIASRSGCFYLTVEQAAAISKSTEILNTVKTKQVNKTSQSIGTGEKTYQETYSKEKGKPSQPKMISLGSKSRRGWKK